MTIIGVVAAMTIPTLHYSRMKQEYSAKLKNFYSRMSNAVLDMEVDHGSFKEIPIPVVNSTRSEFDWYMRYFDPYMGHKMVNDAKMTVYFADGSSLFPYYSGFYSEFAYDVNGDKGPNKLGYDRFYFLFAQNDTARKNCFGNSDTYFGPYCPAGTSVTQMPRETILARCRDGWGNYPVGAWCVMLLQNDQWEFKADYPLKF